jgi:hypothetical protein
MTHARKLALAVACLVVVLSAIPALAQAPDPVGEWALQTNTQGQITPFTLTITREGNVLKGKASSEQYGSQVLTDLKYANGELTYTRAIEVAGQPIVMTFKGKIEGDKMTGAYNVQGVDLPVTGTRKKPSDSK